MISLRNKLKKLKIVKFLKFLIEKFKVPKTFFPTYWIHALKEIQHDELNLDDIFLLFGSYII